MDTVLFCESIYNILFVLIDDGLVKSQHHPSTGSGRTVFPNALSEVEGRAQGESREARDNLLIFRSC